MDSRWQSEFSLSNEELASVIERETSLIVEQVKLLGQGWDFINYLVNGTWVFRIPKRRSEADTLLREKQTLEDLKLHTQHPIFEYWIPQPSGLQVPLAAYRFLPGIPLASFTKNEIDLARFGKAMGNTLAELHEHPKIGKAPRSDPLQSWLGGKGGSLKTDELPVAKLHLSHSTYDTCVRFLNEYRIRKPSEGAVTTHNDLGVEHVLIDENREMSAIIDWADAHVANRYVDFAGIWGWGGDDAIKHMFEHYPTRPLIEELAQIRAHGLCYALGQLLAGDRLDLPEQKEVAIRWIRERASEGCLRNVYSAEFN